MRRNEANAPESFLSIWILLVVLVIVGVGFRLSLHKIEEGHVGVYWRGGALIHKISQPGYHFKIPIVDTHDSVQVTVQTDKVTDIPCGTSGGVVLFFENVEVVNRLKKDFVLETIANYSISYDKIWIFDKIHHFMNQFCSAHTLQEVYIDLFGTVDDRLAAELQADCDRWAPGIEIIAVRITKPRIPQVIARNYELMEAEKTKLMISVQTQKVVEKEAETDRLRAKIEAEKVREVSRIRMEQQMSEKKSLQQITEIEDATAFAHAKSLADAESYTIQKIAEANKLKLQPEFLFYEWIRAISNNTKVYFGQSINQMWLDFAEQAKSTMFKSNNN